jgi:gliding motility-associated-like protein
MLLNAQGGFQESLEGEHVFYGATARDDGETAVLVSLGGGLHAWSLQLLQSFEAGAPQQAAKTILPENGSGFRVIRPYVTWLGGRQLLAATSRSGAGCGIGIIYLDLESGQNWDLCININSSVYRTLAAGDSSGLYLLTGTGVSVPNLYAYRITADGELIFRRGLSFPFASSSLRVEPRDALFAADIEAVAAVAHDGQGGGFILRLAASGESAAARHFERASFDKIVADGEGGYFAAGSTDLLSTASGNGRDLLLAKLDGELGVVWARVFSASGFDYERAAISLLPGGGLALAYSTQGAFPTILAQLDAEGQILWQKGYALYEPIIDVFPDGSLLLATRYHFDAAGNRYFKTIVAKTDADGGIAGCAAFPACLQSSVAALGEGTLLQAAVLDGAPSAVKTGLSVQDTALTSAPFCDIPPPPSPAFSLPDTVCRGDAAAPAGLASQNANAARWELSGPTGDSVWLDSPPDAFRFARPGLHAVRQTVWALGCAQSHEERVEALDSLALSAAADGGYCGPPPLPLRVEASRELSQSSWQPPLVDGAAPANGTYVVTATDGYCVQSDTIVVASLLEGIDPDSILILPPDTAICRAALPFRLAPRSSYAAAFRLGGASGASFELPAAGGFEVSVSIGGCEFAAPFRLDAEDCEPEIFVPTAFSPNADGINDEFQAYGRHHRVLRTEVYSRWGGMAWAADGGRPWDGRTTGGKPAPAGLYVYKIEYEDLRTGERGLLKGEVSLLR